MEFVTSIALVAGYVLLPAAAVIAGGFTLNFLERKLGLYEPAGRPVEGGSSRRVAWTALAIPLAALTAAMVLAPVVFAVVAVVSNELAIGYLGTFGFALGAVALAGLAATTRPAGNGPRWSRVPGVLLSSAVGFAIALMSFLGGAVSGLLHVGTRDPRRVFISIGLMLVVGGLAAAAYRSRQQQQPESLEDGAEMDVSTA